jgi:hypothetical protein
MHPGQHGCEQPIDQGAADQSVDVEEPVPEWPAVLVPSLRGLMLEGSTLTRATGSTSRWKTYGKTGKGSLLGYLPTVLLALWPGEGVVPLIAGARLIIGSVRPESR